MAALVSGNMASATQPRKRATRARFGPTGGKTSGKRRVRSAQLGQHRLHAPQSRRQQSRKPHSFGPVEKADALQQPRWCQRELDPPGIREQVMQDQTLEQAGLLTSRRRAGERDLERLDHLAVLNPGRTCRFARSAIKAQLQVLAHARPHRQPPVGDRAHQVNPAPRAIVLIAGLDIGRTARRTEAAMHTLLIADIGNPLGKPSEIDSVGHLYFTHKASWVHGCVRVEGGFDAFGDGPVWPGLPPNMQALLPRGRTPRQDQVASVPGRYGSELADLLRDLIERPLALCMGADDPIARVGLHRPSLGVKGFDE